jgi:two-component system chemotaxis response regulator CheY
VGRHGFAASTGLKIYFGWETGTEVCVDTMQDDSLIPFEDGMAVRALPSTILLVDDDPDLRSLTRTFLEHEGYRVFTSGDANRAAQIFSSAPRIDLLITDLYMPQRSGMELAFDLKELRRELPVLMISGGVVDMGLQMRLQTEGWRFLAKPFLLTELLSTVHGILAPDDTAAGWAS